MAVKNLRARAAQVATTLEESKKSTKEEEEKLDKTRQEVADLYKQFSEIARETQVKAGHKNVVLEKKLELLAKDYSSKEAQLGEVLGKANLDPNAMQAVVRKTDDVVSMKNQLIKDLQYVLTLFFFSILRNIFHRLHLRFYLSDMNLSEILNFNICSN